MNDLEYIKNDSGVNIPRFSEGDIIRIGVKAGGEESYRLYMLGGIRIIDNGYTVKFLFINIETGGLYNNRIYHSGFDIDINYLPYNEYCSALSRMIYYQLESFDVPWEHIGSCKITIKKK